MLFHMKLVSPLPGCLSRMKICMMKWIYMKDIPIRTDTRKKIIVLILNRIKKYCAPMAIFGPPLKQQQCLEWFQLIIGEQKHIQRILTIGCHMPEAIPGCSCGSKCLCSGPCDVGGG